MYHGLVLSLLSALTYSTLPILVKLAYASGLDRSDMLPARFTVASTVLFLYLLRRDPSLLRIRFPVFLATAGIGFVIYSLQTNLYFAALEKLPVSTVSLVIYFYPVTTTLASVFFFKAKIDRTLVAALVLVTAGTSCVVVDAADRQLSLEGLALVSASLLVYTAYLLLIQKTVARAHPLSVTFYVFLFTGLAFYAMGEPSNLLYLSGEQVLLCLVLGLVPTASAISLLFLAIEKIGVSYTAVFSSLEPAASLLGAFLVLGETVMTSQLAGLVLILAGIVLPNLRGAGGRHHRHVDP